MRKFPLLILLASISLAACGGNNKSALKVSDPQQPIESGAQITLGYYPSSNDPVDPQQTTTFTVTVK